MNAFMHQLLSISIFELSILVTIAFTFVRIASSSLLFLFSSRESVDALREIQSMKKLVHPNILQLEEIIL